MKTTIFAGCLLALLLSSFLNAPSFAQVTDNVDPTVEQFPVIRGFGDPNYNGALSVSIPLMTVPGIHGLNYDISLQYVDGNGVPISQSSSWVGLGWNLQNYEITCNPVNGKIGGATNYYYYNNMNDDGYGPDYVPDLYNLNCPDGSTQFWLDESGYGIPVNWSAIKIQGIHDNNSKEYNRFSVYGIDGTMYVFADRLRKQQTCTLLNHDLTWEDDHPGPSHNYYYVYKLSAILAPDYVDGNEDSTPGNGGADYGAWVKFTYTAPIKYYSNNMSPFNPQEVDYLSSIMTPTHTANFLLGAMESPFIINHQNVNNYYLSALDQIVLKRNNQTTQFRSIKFYQTNGFDWLQYAGDGIYDWVDYLHSVLSNWRTRLDSVKIAGRDNTISEPSYRFDYYYDNLVFNEYESPYVIDNWGYIYLGSDVNRAFPDPNNHYVYGMLKRIVYPTGGSVEFAYEPNYFQPEKNSARYIADNTKAVMAGGLRLQNQTITDPQTGKQQIYQYKYGSTNIYMKQQYGEAYPGVGFCGSDPGATQSAVPTLCYLGGNIRNDVHYPDVTTILPDGSYITKYFTSSCTEVALSASTDYSWIFKDDNNNQRVTFSNNATWPSFVPITGVDFRPYVSANTSGQYKSLQSNDFLSITYPYPLNQYVAGNWYGSEAVNAIAKCELAELDDCNSNLLLSIIFYGDLYPVAAGFLKIVAIDNAWRRGYPVREVKCAANGTIVWSKDYYYEMQLRDVQDYAICVPGAIEFSGNLHFTECSGQVKLIKTAENTY